MKRSKIAGIGYYVPERIVTNDELSAIMDTSDLRLEENTISKTYVIIHFQLSIFNYLV